MTGRRPFLILLLGGLVAASFSCGREPTGASGSSESGVSISFDRALLADQLFPNDPVARAQFTLSTLSAEAQDSAARRSLLRSYSFTRVLGTAIWLPLGSVTQGSGNDLAMALTFPMIENVTYEVEGFASNSSGARLYEFGPATFTANDVRSHGWNLPITMNARWVGDGSQPVQPPRDTVIPQPIPPLVPTVIQLVSGGGQSGLIGLLLSDPIVVKVLAGTVPVKGATVNFAPRLGLVNPTSAVTDANGLAQTRWTLGGLLGAQFLDVKSSGVPNLVVNAIGLALPVPAMDNAVTRRLLPPLSGIP